MALSVRGLSDEYQPRYGTPQAPLPLTIDLSRVEPAPLRLQSRLGYEMVPATQVYSLEAPRHFELRIDRASEDRYARFIAVAVMDLSSRERLYQISRASGEGEWQELPAGRFLVICSLGVAEEVALDLQLQARPYRQRIAPLIAAGDGGGRAERASGRTAIAHGDSPSLALRQLPLLQGVCQGDSDSLLALLAVAGASGRCRCSSQITTAGVATLAPMVWVDGRGRTMTAGTTFPVLTWGESAVVRGSDWTWSVVLRQPGGAGKDLTGLSFVCEVWNGDRSERYAVASVTVADPSAGGPVTATLSSAQTRTVGRYDGEEVVIDLRADQAAPAASAYLLEVLPLVLEGYSEEV